MFDTSRDEVDETLAANDGDKKRSQSFHAKNSVPRQTTSRSVDNFREFIAITSRRRATAPLTRRKSERIVLISLYANGE